MKSVLLFMILVMLAGCASQNENPQNTGPTKADVKAREEFAKSLPKPPER
jgi:type IV pilus biogenesis protein CpaD/CtpE